MRLPPDWCPQCNGDAEFTLMMSIYTWACAMKRFCERAGLAKGPAR